MSEPLVELEKASKQYSEDRIILREVDLTIAPSESLSIIGSSGSGKSTLLNLLGTLDAPDSGTLRVAGHDVTALSEQELSKLRREKIGFIFQLHHLLPQCTVLENVLVPTLSAQGGSPEQADLLKRADHLLSRVGLSDHASKKPSQLSGGERQRVAVVRALINQPALLLADEPTGALDGKTAESLFELLLEMQETEETAFVLVTHDRDLAARLPRQLEITDGQLVNHQGS
ncbi:MAG: ABC transporter ATP-binding protein [Verrucomicrobiota bacterium]